MLKKTMVWGLDKDYVDNKDWIEKKYNIAGYYDTNVSKLPAVGGITKAELADRVNEFDKILVAADPPAIVRSLIDVYNVPIEKIDVLFYELLEKDGPEMVFYGENNEDAVLMLLFEKMGLAVKDIKYLEIGTNDPVRHNNSFSLYRMGARGVLVDAFPTVELLSKKVRPEDKFINCAVSDVSGDNVVFYACESSAYSSLDEEHHRQYENRRPNEVKEISVPLIGINELIDMCNEKPNVLLCDAEGFDEKIVKGVDYSKNNLAVIMLETDHVESEEANLGEFMKQKGFRLYASIKQNDIYYNTLYNK